MSKGYETHTEKDTSYAVFRREFLIPTAAIPPDGLALDVIDRDGTNAELIGSVRVSRGVLISTVFSAQQIVRVSDPKGGLEAMELVVTPHEQGTENILITMSAEQGTTETHLRPLRAGEVVQVQASGQYQIGRWHDEVIDPRGFPGGKWLEYNIKTPPFTEAPHGSGLAILGAGDAKQGLVVASCSSTVARVGGGLLVGVNDNNPDDNRGILQFIVRVRPPTPAEWFHQEAPPCGVW